ncbi:MAG: ABC transporter permease [Comamonadaceae bacterium]|nr:MAG: ABC transporter permease [Comamonadaceae bacterium]
MSLSARLVRIAGIALLLGLPLPIIIVFGASFNGSGYIQFPPESLSLRWYVETFTDPRWARAGWTSLWIAAVVAVVITAVSFLTAFFTIRHAPKWSNTLEMLIFAPLFFPHAAMGVATVVLLAKFDLVGTSTAIVLAHLMIALPFSYRPIYISLRSIDPDLLRAAQVLGASEWRALWDIILPLCRSGILTSLLFSAIISFDEVTVTMFLIGPDVKTLPVQIFTFIQDDASPVLAAISTLSVALTFLAIVLMDRWAGLTFFVQRDAS